MTTQQRIYLDNAATSWPKPEAVYQAVDQYQRDIGAAAGRAGYRNALESQQIVDRARNACGRLLGVADARQIAFTSNGTEALNLAIHGVLRPGDHVVTTVCEHNSVLRPLKTLAEDHQVEVSYVDCDSAGFINPDNILGAIKSNTRLVIVNHGSNVTGAIQPIDEIAQRVHECDALILVDAAQTAGCLPINAEELELDLLATGGHKGLLGPLGTGLLYVGNSAASHLKSCKQGGTGTDSLEESQPNSMPEFLESGNLNVAGLAGLGAGIEFLLEESVEKIHERLLLLTQQLINGLRSIASVKIYGPPVDQPRGSVVSFQLDGYDPQELAAGLDAAYGIECRAGLHCAPRMHKSLGTDVSGGLVRLSPGWATTNSEIEQVLSALDAIAGAST